MGKKGGTSWLTLVKRAFKSPTKDTEKKSSRRREENEQEEEEEQKREKRRWLFRKPSNNNAPQNEAKVTIYSSCSPPPPELPPLDQRHAIAVAAATAAAAEAAVATAQAAVEIMRLTRSSNPSSSVKQNYAAVAIQTAFRGYLARRALVALKGIVKLQALIRGQNVRKQSKMTLKCMQALLRLQTRMRDHQTRFSQDRGGRKSMFAETTNLWESRYIRERKSTSKDRFCISDDDWSECPRTLEDLEAALQARKEAANFKRENSLARAFSEQLLNTDSGYDNELVEERTNSLDKWMATKQWDTCSRGSNDKRDSVKTVEMDCMAPQKQQYTPFSNWRRVQHQISPHLSQEQAQAIPVSLHHHHHHHRSLNNNLSNMVQAPATPSPSKPKPVQVRASNPRYHKEKEDKSYSAANTPSLRSMQRLNSNSRYSVSTNEGNGNAGIPNYMAATKSAKARVRSQSAPRQRPSTPERERGGLARKRLSFPMPPDQPPCCPTMNSSNSTSSFSCGCINNSLISQNLRSPSFKSVQAGYVGMELQSNQSCYTDSIGGEISPCSTTDLRRWLR